MNLSKEQTIMLAMQGLRYIRNFHTGDRNLIRKILTGRIDNDLLSAFSLMNDGLQKTTYQIDKPEIVSYLDAWKNHLEHPKLYPSFNVPSEKASELINQIQTRKEQATLILNQMNKPLAEGSIKEVAAKLGISISEARKHKREGTLHQLLSKVS